MTDQPPANQAEVLAWSSVVISSCGLSDLQALSLALSILIPQHSAASSVGLSTFPYMNRTSRFQEGRCSGKVSGKPGGLRILCRVLSVPGRFSGRLGEGILLQGSRGAGLGVETERAPRVETERAMSCPLLRTGGRNRTRTCQNVTGVAF